MYMQIHPKQQDLKNEHIPYEQRKGWAFPAMVTLTFFPSPQQKSYTAHRGITVTGVDALKKEKSIFWMPPVKTNTLCHLQTATQQKTICPGRITFFGYKSVL